MISLAAMFLAGPAHPTGSDAATTLTARMDGPIGMFDSGFGGLTVARAVIDLLPGEDLVYIGDTGRYPYGPRPQAEVADFAMQLGRSLVDDFAVKAVIVACNTASAAALASTFPSAASICSPRTTTLWVSMRKYRRAAALVSEKPWPSAPRVAHGFGTN